MTADHSEDRRRPSVPPRRRPRRISVVIVDDHELVRRGLIDLLRTTDDLVVTGEAATAAEARIMIAGTRPDVALLDNRLPDGSGIDICRDLRSALPQVRCLMLTSYDDDEALFAAVVAGAAGYLLKQIGGSSLTDAIRAVAAGRSLIDPALKDRLMNRLRDRGSGADPRLAQLTAREREVLELIAQGLTNRQIGERLYLAEKTIKNYVSSLLTKLGMQRRTQAAIYGANLRNRTQVQHPPRDPGPETDPARTT